MNSARDLGGRPGLGPVVPDIDEPPFHAEWERRVFGLVLAMGATSQWNLDMSRFAREDRPLAEYLSMSYYEIWLAALERLLLERDLVTPTEIAAGAASQPPKDIPILLAPRVDSTLRRGAPTLREPIGSPRFTVGQRVRTIDATPTGHTRLPGYARGRIGTVIVQHGCHVFADSHAAGLGEDPRWLYSVSFSARELWGSDADASVRVTIDAFEPYLEAL